MLTHLTIRSPIMKDAVRCTPTCGITNSVSHHDECRLVHPDMWYHLNAIRHHDGCRLVHPAKWEHFFNAIRHHDGCRLGHPAKWDIGKFRSAFVTDVDWCIPSGGSFDISFNSHFRLMNPVLIIIHIHSIFKYHISIPYSLSYYLSKIYSIYVLISYTHSCTHFIYTFMYSSHSYLVNYQCT